MKLILAAAALLAALWSAAVLGGQKQGARPRSPEAQRRAIARHARTERALDALRRGDVSQASEVRDVVASLNPGDHLVPEFAAELDQRGESQAAYELMRRRGRFLENSVPNDGEMALYARLAQKVGHPEEGARAHGRGRSLPGVDARTAGLLCQKLPFQVARRPERVFDDGQQGHGRGSSAVSAVPRPDRGVAAETPRRALRHIKP